MASDLQDAKAVLFADGLRHTDDIAARLGTSFGQREDHGETFAEHAARLAEIGFEEEKAPVVNWGDTKIDENGLGRILHMRESLRVGKSAVALSSSCLCLNLHYLVRHCSGLYTSLHLMNAWRMLCKDRPDVDMMWHDPMWDADATRYWLLCWTT